MSSPALFQCGAGTACTKHLSRLSRRGAAVRARRARHLETVVCPRSVPFKGLTRRSLDLGQLVPGLGGGAEQSFLALRDPEIKRSGSGCPITAMRCRALAMDHGRALWRMGVPELKAPNGSALMARVRRLAHPLPSFTQKQISAGRRAYPGAACSRRPVQAWPPKLVPVTVELPVDQLLTCLVEDAEVEATGVKVDSAVVLVLLGVESHRGLLGERVFHSPHQPTGISSSE